MESKIEKEREKVQDAEKKAVEIDEELSSLIKYLQEISDSIEQDIHPTDIKSRIGRLKDKVSALRTGVKDKTVGTVVGLLDSIKSYWYEARQIGHETSRKTQEAGTKIVDKGEEMLSNWSQVFNSKEFTDYFSSKPLFHLEDWKNYLENSKADPRHWRDVIEDYVSSQSPKSYYKTYEKYRDRIPEYFGYSTERKQGYGSKYLQSSRGISPEAPIGMAYCAITLIYLLMLIKQSWRMRNKTMVYFGDQYEVPSSATASTPEVTSKKRTQAHPEALQQSDLIMIKTLNHVISFTSTVMPLSLMVLLLLEFQGLQYKILVVLHSLLLGLVYLYNSTITEHHGYATMREFYEFGLQGGMWAVGTIAALYSARELLG